MPKSFHSVGDKIGLAPSFYLIGVLWRVYYLFFYHPAQQFLYSDMKGYVDQAENYYSSTHIPNITDTVYPPGWAYVLGAFQKFDSTGYAAISGQLLISSLIPLALYFLAHEIYGLRVARVALIMGSVYFPFVDYASYFLSESLFTLLLIVSVALVPRALRQRKQKAAITLAFAAGITFGLSAAVKSVAIPVGGLIFLCLLGLGIAWRKTRWLQLATALGAGIFLVLLPLMIRCTRANEGRFCAIANDFARGFLLGQMDGIALVQFRDAKRNLFYEFGCPTAVQRGYTRTLELPIGVYENKALAAYTFNHIKQAPLNSLLLSFDHVFDLFFGSIPWPSSNTPQRRWANLSQQLYYLFILLPALIAIFGNRKSAPTFHRFRETGSPEWILVIPYLALLISIAFTAGETRYRIPFDGFAIILACRFYVERRSKSLILSAKR